MEKNKYLAISTLGFFLTGCTGTTMTKNQAALTAAATCAFIGGGSGGAHSRSFR